MMWISIALAVTGKTGTGFLVGLTQAFAMLAIGHFGSHGAFSLISYSIPGLIADFSLIFFRDKSTLTAQVISCTSANVSGTVIVTFLIMRLAFLPLMIALLASIISGITGGIIAFTLYQKLNRYKLF